MSSSLPAPSLGGLVTQWAWQPLAIAAALLLGGWYLRSVRSLRARDGVAWSRWHGAVFALGLVLGLWTSCGFLQAYQSSLYWAWTAQALTLWLLVPAVLLVGRPLQLARATSGPHGRVDRFLRTRLAKVLGNPLVGPALVPLLSVVLFFGPLPAWAITVVPLGWLVQLLLVFVGGLFLLPLLGIDEQPSTLAVALTLAIGSFELVLDAIPGIVLRLHRSLVTSYFAHAQVHPWSPRHLHDQQTAGTILWVVAEVIDLPFVLLVYRRWLRVDAREAAEIDAVLEAERAARSATAEGSPSEAVTADAPWWLSDPTMQQRMRRRG